MSQDDRKGSYTYPGVEGDADRTGVLRNRFGLTRHSELRPAEYAMTHIRMTEIAEGRGPRGDFDKAHLKALHHHIFQDVYEWAGAMRNEAPIVDGRRVEPAGTLSKGGTSFVPAQYIERGLAEAMGPLRDRAALQGASAADFADLAGRVMGELNYVHPFREGNGRAQQTLIAELGRVHGHDVDFSAITRTRMIDASIVTTHDPDSPALRHAIEDAVDPNRRAAIKAAISDVLFRGGNPEEFHIATARPGEEIVGQVLAHDDRFASVVTQGRIVAVDRADLPEQLPDPNVEIAIVVRSDFSRVPPERHAAPQPPTAQAVSDPRQNPPQGRERDDDGAER